MIFELGLAIFDWPTESILWDKSVAHWYSENASIVSFVAECETDIIGFILCFVADSVGRIEWVAVDQQFREKGIASRLAHRVLLVFKALGVENVTALVREDGCADMFFHQLGFEKCELRKVELSLNLSNS
jgi:ribosomal protein S18 acetylase RimI-like enzyme